jgi:hypothetical protein
VALVKREQFSIEFNQVVAIIGIMAVKAPEVAATMNKGPNRIGRSQSIFFHVLIDLNPLADSAEIFGLEISAVIKVKQ